MPWRRAGRSFVASAGRRNINKPRSHQNCRRTAARVSVKVGRRLRDQAGVQAHGRACSAAEARGKQGHHREQRAQAGCGACSRPVRPLPLGLHTETVARLTEGDLHLPTLDEPAHDLQRVAPRIGAQKGLRLEAVLRIARQHPADRHDRQAGMVPNGRGGAELHDPRTLAIPARHGGLHPACALVGQDDREVRPAGALDPRAPDRSGLAWRRRLVQGRVQPQAGDTAQPLAGERRPEIQGGEAAVAR